METFPVTAEIGDPQGQRFEPVEMLAGTGAMFTTIPGGGPGKARCARSEDSYREAG